MKDIIKVSPRMHWNGLRDAIRRLRKDTSGVGTIEFAIIMIFVMIPLYLGGIELSEALTIKRKVTNAASSLGDLVTRTKAISPAEMDDIIAAAGAVVFPYPPGGLRITLACVSIDNDKTARVRWNKTDGSGIPPLDVNELPPGVVLANSKLVISEVRYAYAPMFGEVFLNNPIELTSRSYLKPRAGNTVCYNDVCC